MRCRMFLIFVCVLYVLPENKCDDMSVYEDEKQDLKSFDWNVWCKFQPAAFDCSGKGGIPRYYYDLKLQDCKTFDYGFCPNSFNNFNTLTSCHETCRDAGLELINENMTDNVFCRLQPDFGNCNEYHPRWYYDITLRLCRGFSFSGCGGNENRFSNSQECTAVCAKAVDF